MVNKESHHYLGITDIAVAYTKTLKEPGHAFGLDKTVSSIKKLKTAHPSEPHIFDIPPLRILQNKFNHVVLITDPALAAEVSMQTFPHFFNDDGAVGEQRGKGILVQNDRTKWLHDKRQLAPALNRSHVSEMSMVIQNATQSSLESVPLKPDTDLNHWIETMLIITRAKAFYGYELTPQQASNIAHETDELVNKLPLILLGLVRPDPKTARKAAPTVNAVMTELEQHFKNNTASSLLLDAHFEELDEPTEFQRELLVTGTKLETVTCKWLMYALAKNPQYRQQLQTLTGEKQAAFARQCVLETMRLYPTTSFNPRFADKQIHLKNGQTIPQDSLVIYATCTYPGLSNNWDHPQEFDPYRPNLHKEFYNASGSISPFGHTERTCIGREYALASIAYLGCAIATKYPHYEIPQTVEPLTISGGLKPSKRLTIRP